ncbi:MAG: PAAR domain-containing protein [Acidithiobacillus sp.]|jgi:uncharacterized Zn-binding protein involved in type VI secretion|uniref:PAAR domain-containing protein n=1 Tax=Acidithiobacillus sp. TaxID=1872118 RepID=UPI00355FDE30
MGLPSARVGDKALCPIHSHGRPDCPHLNSNGPITVGSSNVFINSKPAARQNDSGVHAVCCDVNTFKITTGSSTVFVNGKPLARQGDSTLHRNIGSGTIQNGSSNTFVG